MTDRNRLRVLEELGMEFDRVIALEARPQRLPLRRALVLGLAAALLLAGVAAAASYLLTGSPIPSARQRDVPAEATPRPGTARVVDLRAADPGGAPPWTLRLSRSHTGQLCAAVGQVVEGTFGLVGLDGRFRRLPLLGVDACAAERGRPPAMIGARMFDAERPRDVRTVLYGVAGEGLDSAVVRGPNGERRLEVSDGGAFVAAFRGYVEDVQPRVTLRFEDGTRREFPFGAIKQASAPDPQGGPPWTVDADERRGERAGQTCAQFRRARGRFGAGFGALSYPICGDLGRDRIFFEVAPFPRAQDHRDIAQTFAWGYAPARTVLWGAADESVAAVTVRHAGRDVPVDLSAEGSGFVRVFPAGTQPEALQVVVRLRDGTVRTYRGGQNLRDADGDRRASDFRRPVLGRVGGGPPQPRRPAAPGPRAEADPFRHDRDTVRMAARRAAPGPDWALRTWRAEVRRTGQAMRCVQLGRVDARGRFRLPGERSEPAPVNAKGAACAPARKGQMPHRAETFLDDPLAYAPTPVRTVVWGSAGPGARKVTLVGPWGRRELRTGVGGAFVLVVGPHLLDTRGVHVLATYADGTRRSARNPGFRPARVVPGSVRIEARAPDPEGLQPWGVQVWQTRKGGLCRHEGRIVAGRAGAIDHDRGTFAAYPMYEGGSCSPAGRGALPAEMPVGISIGAGTGGLEASEALRQARIRRRTLPGRTTISARARPDVETVTFRTPRDVRTLRPSGRTGSILLVYDGEFLGGGTITYTATFKDGRHITHELPLMP